MALLRRSPADRAIPCAISPGSAQAGIVTGARMAGTYWLGTDDKGRDILSRLIYGSRLVLFWSIARDGGRLYVGMLHGRDGRIQRRLVGRGHLLLRQCAPLLPADGSLSRHLVTFRPESPHGHNISQRTGSGTVGVGPHHHLRHHLLTAPQVARIVRGLVLDLKTRDYIAAAEVRGERPLYIMLVESASMRAGPSSSMPACGSAM